MATEPKAKAPKTEPKAKAPEVPEGFIVTRITKKGDGKVCDGLGGQFAWKDEPALPEASAKALEDKGWVEIG